MNTKDMLEVIIKHPAYAVDVANRKITVADWGDLSLDDLNTPEKLLTVAYTFLARGFLDTCALKQLLEACAEAGGVPLRTLDD